MTTEKVIFICGVMMLLEYLYIKQNAGKILASGIPDSTVGGAIAGAAVVDVANVLLGV